MRSASFSRSSSSSRATARPSRNACRAAAIRRGIATGASPARSCARSAKAVAGEMEVKTESDMDETLSQKKWGEKRFRALQTDRTTRVFSTVNSTAPVQRGRKNAAANTRNGHDRLHIFFHPDYDRRLWHLTRSADPVNGDLWLAIGCKPRSRALAGSREAFAARIPPVGNCTPP